MNQTMSLTFSKAAASIAASALLMAQGYPVVAQTYSGSVAAVNPAMASAPMSGGAVAGISRAQASLPLPAVKMTGMELTGTLGNRAGIQNVKESGARESLTQSLLVTAKKFEELSKDSKASDGKLHDSGKTVFDQGKEAKAGAGVSVNPSQAARAVEPGHELGNVTGTDIEMKVYDHAVAGAINGAVAWGFFNEAAASAQLLMRKYGQAISAEFKRQPDKSLGGVITSGEGASQRTTSVFFAGADPAANTFKLRINEETVVVSITAEGMSNGHFVNPTYSTVINGKPVSYRIEAEGCMGYSINMAMIILGAYAH